MVDFVSVAVTLKFWFVFRIELCHYGRFRIAIDTTVGVFLHVVIVFAVAASNADMATVMKIKWVLMSA